MIIPHLIGEIHASYQPVASRVEYLGTYLNYTYFIRLISAK